MEEIHRKYHEASAFFPLLEDGEFEQLKADITANGLLEAIWLHPDGSILDGRNRHRACIETGIESRFRTWDSDGSPMAFVVSMNLHRRHLTYDQRVGIALKLEPAFTEEARKRMLAGIPVPKSVQGRAVGQAARQAHVGKSAVIEMKAAQREKPSLADDLIAGKTTVREERRARQDAHTIGVMGSSESPEWYTPQHIIDLTLELFGGTIDTDPCSNSKTSPNIPATFLYTKDDDGLAQPWHGAVYMNPPYGKEIPLWIGALIDKYEKGEVREAIALLPGRIDTQWFQPLYEYLICHIRGRIQFSNAVHSAPFPSVIVYLGENTDGFIAVFGTLGPIMKRIG